MTNESKEVCVAVPVYNGERYLAETLDSVLGQTYENLDIVVSDNASTDGTEEIVRSYAARDRRIRYVRHAENIGAARNYVHGLQLARGEYFRWQPADDLAAPTLVERCVEVLALHPEVVQAFGKAILIDETGAEIGPYDDDLHCVDDRPSRRFGKVLKNLGLVNAIYGVLRTQVLRKTLVHGSFLGADLVVQGELALHGKLWQLPEYLFYRRMHGKAHSSMTEAERQAFYNPSNPSTRHLYYSRLLLEQVKSVMRASVGVREEGALLLMLARQALWFRADLAGELWGLLRSRGSGRD